VLAAVRPGSRPIVLACHTWIGRGRACLVRLLEPDVSVEHAAIRWNGEAWEVRDLGSRNGTFCNGERLAAGVRTLLARGSTLRFGGSSEWRLEDAEPPGLLAVELDGDGRIVGQNGYLALPDPERPSVCVLRSDDGRWIAEREDGLLSIRDGEVLVADGRAFRIFLGSGLDSTEQAGSPRPIELFFVVSRDEEHVELRVRVGDVELDLGERAHHYVLLALARLTQAEALDPEIDPNSRGWIEINEFARRLGTDRTYVNLCIHRLRKQLADSRLARAASMIERRSTSGELRLNAARVHVRPAGEIT
jgi:hypothetical protein